MDTLILFIQPPLLIFSIYHIFKHHRATLPLQALLFINLFSFFRIANINWWVFYFLIAAYMSMNILRWSTQGRFIFFTSQKHSIQLIFLFILFGIFSIISNLVNFFDGLFVIFLRLAPVITLLYVEQLVQSHNTPLKLIPSRRFNILLLFFLLGAACIQYFILGRYSDGIKSITGNAHIFCGFLLVLTLFISFSGYRKHLFMFYTLLAVNLFFFIVADYKLGIISLILSFFLSKIYLKGLSQNNSYLLYAFAFSFFSFILIYNFDLLLPMLPNKFKILMNFFSQFHLALNTHSVTLATLELPKGYLQLFSEVLKNPFQFFFGVGPGNYCSNIAILKEKSNALHYCISYRETLTRMGFHGGTFQDRSNALVNLIGEFGLVGTGVYFAIFYVLIAKPINRFKSHLQTKQGTSHSLERQMFIFIFFLIFLILQCPFQSIFESSFYVGCFGLLYGAVLLSQPKLDPQ